MMNVGPVAKDIENGAINFVTVHPSSLRQFQITGQKTGPSSSRYKMIQTELEKTSHLVEHGKKEGWGKGLKGLN